MMKGLKMVGGGLGKATKVIKPYKTLAKELKGTGKQAHHILEKRMAQRLGVSDTGSIPSIALTKSEHQQITNALRKEIPYGTDYSSLSDSQIRNAYANVYGEGSDMLNAIAQYLP